MSRLLYKRNGQRGEKIIPHHKCTKEELDDFAPPVADSVALFELYRQADSERHLFCLDWDRFGDDLAIWGTENDEFSYQRFEYTLLPCNYIHAEYGDIGETMHPECTTDRDKQIEYLGNMRLVFLTTEQVFD